MARLDAKNAHSGDRQPHRIAQDDDRLIPAQSSFVIILISGKVDKRGFSATIARTSGYRNQPIDAELLSIQGDAFRIHA
jgi:hypothetical protein